MFLIYHGEQRGKTFSWFSHDPCSNHIGTLLQVHVMTLYTYQYTFGSKAILGEQHMFFDLGLRVKTREQKGGIIQAPLPKFSNFLIFNKNILYGIWLRKRKVTCVLILFLWTNSNYNNTNTKCFMKVCQLEFTDLLAKSP